MSNLVSYPVLVQNDSYKGQKCKHCNETLQKEYKALTGKVSQVISQSGMFYHDVCYMKEHMPFPLSSRISNIGSNSQIPTELGSISETTVFAGLDKQSPTRAYAKLFMQLIGDFIETQPQKHVLDQLMDILPWELQIFVLDLLKLKQGISPGYQENPKDYHLESVATHYRKIFSMHKDLFSSVEMLKALALIAIPFNCLIEKNVTKEFLSNADLPLTISLKRIYAMQFLANMQPFAIRDINIHLLKKEIVIKLNLQQIFTAITVGLLAIGIKTLVL